MIPRCEVGWAGSPADFARSRLNCERLLELGLHERLVVREDEPAARAAFVQLGRVGDRSPPAVREVGHLAVRHVEDVGREPGHEAGDRGVVLVARERVEDRVVAGRRADLPALRVEEPRPEGVVVRLQLEVDAVEQALDGLRLGLGASRGPTIGVARDRRRGALVVVVEVRADSCGSGRRRRRPGCRESPFCSRRFLRQRRVSGLWKVYW